MFNFEKLEVWQKAVELADTVYVLTNTFPDDERYGLSSQMRRAAVSVSANIAEGASRHSRDDFNRFLEIASGSLFELVSHAFIARRRGYLPDAPYKDLYTSAENASRMLSGLRRSLGRTED